MVAADTAAEGRPPEASNPSHANNSAGHNRCQRAWVAACRPPWAEGLGDRNTWRGASAACAPWADWACREGWAEADFGSHTPWACRSFASQRDNLHDTLEILSKIQFPSAYLKAYQQNIYSISQSQVTSFFKPILLSWATPLLGFPPSLAALMTPALLSSGCIRGYLAIHFGLRWQPACVAPP